MLDPSIRKIDLTVKNPFKRLTMCCKINAVLNGGTTTTPDSTLAAEFAKLEEETKFVLKRWAAVTGISLISLVRSRYC